MPTRESQPVNETNRGILYGALAYGAWGILPIYFHALEPAGPLEILAQRILWSAIFCLLFWMIRRDFDWLKTLLRQPRQAGALTLAAYLLAVNWGVYIYSVHSDNVLESSLGYFINPLFLVLIGVFVLGERLNTMQWTAIGLGTVAVLVIAIDYGRPPWIALILAASFTGYGYIKKMVGVSMGALETMTAESFLLVPFALLTLWWVKTHANDLTFTSEGWSHTTLLILLGVITILPLTLFSAAATRLPLTILGLLQFLAPIGQFLVGVFIFHEVVPTARWIGFVLVWIALLILTADTFRSASRRRRLRAA